MLRTCVVGLVHPQLNAKDFGEMPHDPGFGGGELRTKCGCRPTNQENNQTNQAEPTTIKHQRRTNTLDAAGAKMCANIAAPIAMNNRALKVWANHRIPMPLGSIQIGVWLKHHDASTFSEAEIPRRSASKDLNVALSVEMCL